jgi:hypothetical protein
MTVSAWSKRGFSFLAATGSALLLFFQKQSLRQPAMFVVGFVVGFVDCVVKCGDIRMKMDDVEA